MHKRQCSHEDRKRRITFAYKQSNIVLNDTKLIKVLEYLRTCNIFYLISGPRVTFGIFDLHMLKKGILSYQTK